MSHPLPASPETARPLPRSQRKRPQGAPPRRRLEMIDVFWLAFSILLSSIIHFWKQTGPHLFSLDTLFLALTPGAVYLLGWRNGGRFCGITASLLTATSPVFARTDVSVESAAFILATFCALFAEAAEVPAAAAALAGATVVARPDGIVLCLILLALIAIRTPKQALPSAGLLLLVAASGWALRLAANPHALSLPTLAMDGRTSAWLLAPAMAFLVWLLVPFCAEMTDPARRRQWLPLALWTILYGIITSFVHFVNVTAIVLPLLPALFTAAAGGLARLLPMLAGEILWLRHILATLAILLLLMNCFRLEQPSSVLTPATTVLAPPAATPSPAPTSFPIRHSTPVLP